MEKINFNKDWLFTKSEESYKEIKKEEKNVSVVTLPHCYNAIDGQSGEGMYKGKALYQKVVTISEKELEEYHYLEIGAASLVSAVYINKKIAYSCKCGFSMYRVFLNPYLMAGENEITIMVDNSVMDDVYPLMADFSFYGGLYRDAYWMKKKFLHFDLLDQSIDGIYVNQKHIKDKTFELKIKGNIICETKKETHAKVMIALLDHQQNKIVEKSLDMDVKEEKEFEFSEIINDLTLWQGIENPYLYQLEIKLVYNNEVYDEKVIEIGFRHIEITADRGVFLNGVPIKLNGVSRHQDYEGIGNALTKAHMEKDMALIKEVGANSVRLSHYQHHDYFYTLCDREGILVWAEIPFISVPVTKDSNNTNAKEQLEKLIRQGMNHCSIYCWGVQNEITIAIENETIYNMVRELVTLARDLDSSRYIAQANIHSVANESELNGLTDFVGYNLYYGWYYKEIKDLASRLDDFHKVQPDIPVMVTEYGVDTNPKYHSYEPCVKDYTEEYQLMFHNNALKTFKERDFVLGGYVWAMFDFGSEIRNEGGVKGKNQKGLITIDRKLKKDSFYLCKAYWSKEPFVKLAGSRFVNRHKKENDITILSNLNYVKLYVNQELVGEVISKEPMKIIKGVQLKQDSNEICVEAFDADNKVYSDQMTLNYVQEEDKSYVIEKKVEQAHVTNWFQEFDLTNVQEVTLKEGYYSTFDTIEELFKNEKAKAVFVKYFKDVADNPQIQAMKGLMTIDSMSKRSRFRMPKELLTIINKELNEIKKS